MRHAWILGFGVACALAGCGGDADPAAEAPAADSAFPVGHPPARSEPAHEAGGFSIEIPPTTLQPGEEKFPCWVFPLELRGTSRLVGGAKLTPAPGMHHGNITSRPKTGDGIRECDGAASALGGEADDIIHGGAVLFGSSTQVKNDEWQSFPDGMAYRVKEGFEIVARMHYLNATSEALTLAPKYEWFTIDESALKQELGAFIWKYSGFEIPPQSELTVTGTCRIPQPMHLVNLLPHMHKLGTAFEVGFLGGAWDGREFLASKGYDPDQGVLMQYDPGVDLSQGDGATFSCTWKNTFDKTIVEGVGDNEMCMMFGYAWPPANAYTAAAGPLGCIAVAPP